MKQKPFNPRMISSLGNPGRMELLRGKGGLLLVCLALGVLVGGVFLALWPWRFESSEEMAVWSVDFYYPEQTTDSSYSFSRPNSQAFMPNLPYERAKLVLRVQSPAPLPARRLTIGYNQRDVVSSTIGDEPRLLQLLLPTADEQHSAGLVVNLTTEAATTAGDNRQLGMLFHTIATKPLQAQSTAPWPQLALAVSLLAVGLGVGARLVWRWEGLALRRLAAPIGLVLLCGSWAAIIGTYSITRYTLYRAGTYDLGLYDQTLWLISRGYTPYNTGMGIHTLGNHAAFLLYPLSLIYWIAPHVATLLIVQSLVVALGALPIYLIARAHGSAILGLIVAAAYLLHPSTQNMTLFDFHPDTLAATALLFALWAVDQRRWIVVYICCGIVLAAKENFSLTVAFLGLWLALWQRERLRGGILGVVGIAWFFFTTQVVLPTFNAQGQSIHMIERYGQYGGSMSAILLTFIRDPSLLIQMIFKPESLGYLWQLFVPFGLLCIASPHYLVLAAPAIFLNLLSNSISQKDLFHHYGALAVAITAVATLYTLLRLYKHVSRKRLLLGASVVYLLCTGIYGLTIGDLRVQKTQAEIADQSARLRYYDYMISLIPPDSSVAAQMMLQSHLSHRQQAFLLPNPFEPLAFFDPQAMPYTASVDYILYDTRHSDDMYIPGTDRPDIIQALQERGLYKSIVRLNGVVLLRRSEEPLPAECFGTGWQADQCQVQPVPEK